MMGSFSNWKNSGSFSKSTKGGEKKGKKEEGGEELKKGKRREKTGGQIEKKKGEKIGKRFFPSWEDILQ